MFTLRHCLWSAALAVGLAAPAAAATISVGDVTILEGDSGTTLARFPIALSDASPNIVQVRFSTADGTATAGSDYTAQSVVVSFLPGNPTSGFVDVPIIGDTIFEPDETFTVNLTNPVNVTIDDAQGIGTITNDDPTPPTISVGDVTIAEGDSGTTVAQFPVTLSAASLNIVQVRFSTADGTATAGSDYTAESVAIVFPPGQRSALIDVAISGDTIFEPDETFTVNLTNPLNATIADAQGIGTITNDDPTPPTISVGDVTILEGDSGTTLARFPIALSAASPNIVQVRFSTADGTATAGSDYTAQSVVVSFLPGNPTSGFVDVPIIGDTIFEPDETFTVNLTNPVNVTIADAQGIGTITNDDPTPPTISVGDVTILEGDSGTTLARFPIALSAASPNIVQVRFSTADGTATAGSDYTAQSVVVSFLPGNPTSGFVDVPIIGDTIFEPDETFTVNLTNPVNVTIADAQGIGTITNDDLAPGSVTFVVNSGDDGSYVFTSATPGLNFTVTTTGGAGSSPAISLAPGAYAVAFTTPDGAGLTSASCAPSASTVNTSSQTAALTIASTVNTVCTINALPARRAAAEIIGTALAASSRLILANGPELARRLGRLNGAAAGAGTASVFGKTFAANLPFSAEVGDDRFAFSSSLSALQAQATPAGMSAPRRRFDIFVEGVIAGFDASSSSDGTFAIIHAGADYLVTDDLLLGVGVQGDWLNLDSATGTLDSNGWLAGPYLTARLSENLYLDLRAAWGGASFDVSPFGTYTDTVDSDRALYTAALIGDFTFGKMTLRPEARVSWYRETTDAYVDSLNVAIPSIEIKTGEVTFGPTLSWNLKDDRGGTFVPSIGVDLVWTFEQENTATQFTGAPGLDDTGLRGRIEAGLTYVSAGGVSIGASVSYDGIGGDDYEAWAARAAISFGF